MLTGRSFDADEARAIRFVNRVVPDGALDCETDALATELASKPALVVRTTKRQVEEASPSAASSDGGGDADAGALAEAFADPESQAAASHYVTRRREQRS